MISKYQILAQKSS